MIVVSRTFDYELVKRIVTDPEVYPWLSDDGSPAPEEWHPAQTNAVYYVLVERDDKPVGVYMLIPQNSVCYEGHTALLPETNGEGAEIAEKVQRWMFENTRCRRIVGNAPTFNQRALAYALKANMTPYGVNPKSFLKDGVLYDQIMLGVSREDIQICR